MSREMLDLQATNRALKDKLTKADAELERFRALLTGPDKVSAFLVNALRLLNDDELSRLTEQLAARSAWGRAQEGELERLRAENERLKAHLAERSCDMESVVAERARLQDVNLGLQRRAYRAEANLRGDSSAYDNGAVASEAFGVGEGEAS